MTPVSAPRSIFAVAGIYGLIVLLPLFFAAPWLEPAPNRPEDYYGFLGAASVMQRLSHHRPRSGASPPVHAGGGIGQGGVLRDDPHPLA